MDSSNPDNVYTMCAKNAHVAVEENTHIFVIISHPSSHIYGCIAEWKDARSRTQQIVRHNSPKKMNADATCDKGGINKLFKIVFKPSRSKPSPFRQLEPGGVCEVKNCDRTARRTDGQIQGIAPEKTQPRNWTHMLALLTAVQ